MKPTNPMTQLQQWKDNRAPVNGKHVQNCEIDCETAKQNKTQLTLDDTGFIKRNCETGCEFAKAKNDSVKNANQTNFGLVKNTQGNEHRETKNKYQGKLSINLLVVEYSQLTRQFKLIHDSNRKCLEVYPDDFHHKLKMREECADLAGRLKGGGKLFNELAKGTNLTQE
ncbi:Uncharacterised protein [Haemophilus parainfluenzae]|uniref:Uncharacterized protein n=1 Tax=Haemophilus parainfluenzae TaxID=729 RepID=A0A377JM15_HAEPA|nr:Uncharacterised protein [Haemophilus parainfluenzae]